MTSHAQVVGRAAAAASKCLGCGSALSISLVDLGVQPLANSYIRPERLNDPEPKYPLHVRVCTQCLLAQVDNLVPPELIFNHDYAYHSSCSQSWLRHCQKYSSDMIHRFGLGPSNRVIEIASNDGYLLQYFTAAGIPVLGIEPSGGVADIAESKGVATHRAFFGSATAAELASRGICANLLAAKNVLAHVPDINDFVAGIPILLAPGGVFTVEFPHLLNLIRGVQFDTIYHEHFSYLSLLAVRRIFERHGLWIFDVERLATHGGSLRVFAARAEDGRQSSATVEALLNDERAARLDRREGYEGFQEKAVSVRSELLEFLNSCIARGKTVAAYGAAAKGNTLLNYCGITTELVGYVVDVNPAKQDTLLPGSRLPVRAPEVLQGERPDFLLILPWNLREEIVAQNANLQQQGTRFVTAIPTLEVF